MSLLDGAVVLTALWAYATAAVAASLALTIGVGLAHRAFDTARRLGVQ